MSVEGVNCMAPPAALLRNLFESESGDWTMVGSDGVGVKFHRAILAEQVPHFRALFSHGHVSEFVNKQIVIPPEMVIPGVSVEAFLRYVYYQDTAAMTYSFRISCALIRVGYYYMIPALIDQVAEVIRTKGLVLGTLEWFTVDDLWKLYQNAWLWEQGHPSKSKLMDLIVAVLKRFCKMGSSDALLPLTTSGDAVVLSCLILALGQHEPCTLPHRNVARRSTNVNNSAN